ncbi:hypothetical protein [Myxococcus eversor]|uniref:hypothetical protein n=1 Tax=Myxococcus eversor TaxID=2709661 RepID=UPI0013D877E4|nr:hypothetical protein [Myxococcus eversor]
MSAKHSTLPRGRATRLQAPPFLLTLALLSSGVASAQTSQDRAYVGFSWTKGTEIGSRGGKLKEHLKLEVRPMMPILELGTLKLIPTLGFETRWMGMERRTAPLHEQEGEKSGNLHRFQLGLSLLVPVSPRGLLLVGASGNIRPDFSKGFKEFDASRDTSWTGFALGSYFLGGDPRKTLTLGVATQYPFEKVPVIPVVGFTYRMDPYILELGFPRATLLMKVGSGLELGFTGGFERQVFRVDLPASSSAPGVRYLSQTELRLGPTVNLRMGSSDLWLSTSAGLDFLDDYALLDENRERIFSDLPGSTKPAPYLRILMSWRPPHRSASSNARPTGPSTSQPSSSGRSTSPLPSSLIGQ